MKYDIAILAGGLGSRLRNTEKSPKPLVYINGLSLLSRIIISLNETGLFNCFHILTCGNSGVFEKVLSKEIDSIDFVIYNEINRTGRIGALINLLNCNQKLETFFVCNGDTLFRKLNSKEIIDPIKDFKFLPIVYIAMADESRNDYKAIEIKKNRLSEKYQNSGLFFMSRKWFEYNLNKPNDYKDIDDLLFSDEGSSKIYVLSTSLLDAGTPERLSYIRRIVN